MVNTEHEQGDDVPSKMTSGVVEKQLNIVNVTGISDIADLVRSSHIFSRSFILTTLFCSTVRNKPPVLFMIPI